MEQSVRLFGMSRDSVVGIVTSCRVLDQRRESSSPGKDKNFSLSVSSRPAVGSTHPPMHWVPGALSPGVKRWMLPEAGPLTSN
jgi:hypothetical protein